MVLSTRDVTPQVLSGLRRLRDDTEEDLLGSDWHRAAIRALYDSLWAAAAQAGLPWHVGDQLEHLIPRPGMADWRPSPDIAVHLTAGQGSYTSFDTRAEGMPPFVVEVVSRSTWRHDIGAGTTPDSYGKVFGYGYAGVREYLVFDPDVEWLGAPVRAWRRTAQGFVPWEAGPDGRWHSTTLGLSLEVQAPLLRVYDAAGLLLPIFREAHQRIEHALGQARRAELEAEAERQRAEAERQRAETERQRAETERQRAEQAEQRAATLEAELRRRQGET